MFSGREHPRCSQLSLWAASEVRTQPQSSDVSDDGPLVRLPDEAVLTRDEVATVLAALDVFEGLAVPSDEPLIREAITLPTTKLWPELGGLLGDDDG